MENESVKDYLSRIGKIGGQKRGQSKVRGTREWYAEIGRRGGQKTASKARGNTNHASESDTDK